MKLIDYEKSNSNSIIRIIFSLFIILFAISACICIYCTVIYPLQLSTAIKKEIIELYAPTAINEEEGAVLLTLAGKPSKKMQKTAYEYFLHNYGLEIIFIDNKEKCFIEFFKGNSKFRHSGTVCLRWNEKSPELNPPSKKTVSEKKNEIKQTVGINKAAGAKIAVVLDDAGYNYQSADIFYKSQLPLTFALIPDLPNSYEHYEKICNAGMNLILHIPMEPEKGADFVEKQAILVSMTREEITSRLELFFNHYPKAAGMNNHMGSRAVKDFQVMDTVLSFAKKRRIFWLDSKTTPASVSYKVAREKKLAYLERDVFLDNENTEEYAEKAMIQLIKIAKKRGYAVGIGHVQSDKLYPVLEKYNEKQDELEIEFVPLIDLIL